MTDLLTITDWPKPQPASEPPPSVAREPEGETRYKLHRRFDRLGRLYGDEGIKTLLDARVAVFGLGGVGSFAAEALARSAVGHLFLADFDDVCVTNTNRQLQAMKGTIGESKVDVLAERLRLINPQAKVHAERAFYKVGREDELLAPPWPGQRQYDFVVDCVDNMSAKAHLLATCHARGIPVVSSMGAAGKMDPTRIRIVDLASTEVCRLARDLRRILRKKHGFPAKGAMGLTAVYSDEPRAWPRELHYDEGKGFRCVCPHRSPEHGCESRQLIDGTAVFVTGAFGLACASVVVNTLGATFRDQAPAAEGLRGTRSKHEREEMS